MDPTVIRYASTFIPPVAFFLSGYSFSFSQNTVPLIYDVRPHISTPVFKGVFYNGASVVVPGALIASSAAGYLAYVLPERRRAYITAAIAILATGPWTQLIMGPGIKRLIEIADANTVVQDKVQQTLEHRQLLKAWVRQNWVRAGLYLFGGIVSAYATMA